ncbi:hypothetical protein K438DRAFT_1485924, partial [Mycena galopus ATCC 62051]
GVSWLAPFMSAALIGTTIHIQDYRDVIGDKKAGRTTLPIVLPELCRWLTSVLALAWSLGLPVYWNINVIYSCMFF